MRWTRGWQQSRGDCSPRRTLTAARVPGVCGQLSSAGSLWEGRGVMRFPSSQWHQRVNAVPATRRGSITRPITLPTIAPPECASAAAGLGALLVGSASLEFIRGRHGQDALVGGPDDAALVVANPKTSATDALRRTLPTIAKPITTSHELGCLPSRRSRGHARRIAMRLPARMPLYWLPAVNRYRVARSPR